MNRMLEVTIGERLKRLRERMKMSQADMQEATGIAVSVLSRYERDVMVPGWAQIEKILTALNANPCDLFDDYCAEWHQDTEQQTFAVDYFERRPIGPEAPVTPTKIVRLRKSSPLVEILGIAATDHRYTILRAASDLMIPDIYPGDLTVTDREAKPAAGKVIAGYLDGEPMMGRLIRHRGGLHIVPSNRRYPPMGFDPKRWDHRGIIIHSVRDLTVRYLGSEEGFIDEGSDVISPGGAGL